MPFPCSAGLFTHSGHPCRKVILCHAVQGDGDALDHTKLSLPQGTMATLKVTEARTTRYLDV